MPTLEHTFVDGFCTVCQESEVYALQAEEEEEVLPGFFDWEGNPLTRTQIMAML